MPIECAYSFKDLYFAAFGKNPNQDELKNFGEISQDERNLIVKKWAAKAGWETKDKPGDDGLIYTAFCPKFD